MKKSAELQALYIARDGFASKVDFDVRIFVFSSCDFVDRSFSRQTKDDPRSHTNQHEPKQSGLELDPTFEAKPLVTWL
jgi:hypothetical protein